MTAPTPNAELAYRVLDHIDAHPEQWDQGNWIRKAECGTVGCFAGWAVLLSGAKPAYYSEHPDAPVSTVIVEGDRWDVSYLAQKLLRAERLLREDTEDEEDLFSVANTREDLGRLVAEIFGPRPEPATDRWSAPIPDPHPMANCGPLTLPLPPGVACPTCGTVAPVEGGNAT